LIFKNNLNIVIDHVQNCYYKKERHKKKGERRKKKKENKRGAQEFVFWILPFRKHQLLFPCSLTFQPVNNYITPTQQKNVINITTKKA